MSDTVATTRAGRLEGLSRDGILQFRGIPYAMPPTGEFRFQSPRPVQPWQGTRLAQTFSLPAPQELSPLMGVDKISDDCLYLNVWTPALDNKRRPVMVWLHGGGFLTGSGHQVLYNGEKLARTQDVVVVTINYRLGLFGFGNLRDLLGNEFPAETNIGLRDQVAALEWVRDNIENFGGDPSCVTIFGESAGGMCVATLLAVPAARGLFHRAIVQSGGADFVLSRDEAAKANEAAVNALGETKAARIHALLQGDVGAIIKAQRRATTQSVNRGMRKDTPQFGMTLMPVVDGDFLPQRPIDAIIAGAARDIPLLASVTRDEWNLFVFQPQFAGGRNEKAEQLDEERLAHVFERALPGRGQAALDFYRNRDASRDCGRQQNGKLVDHLCWLETDRMFRVPTSRMLSAQAKHQPHTYAAQFTWACPQFGGTLGACHVVDVPFVFGSTAAPAGQFFTGGGEPAERLSAQVMNAWGNFARGGNPQSLGDEVWPAYDNTARPRSAMIVGPATGITALPEDDVLDFWSFLS